MGLLVSVRLQQNDDFSNVRHHSTEATCNVCGLDMPRNDEAMNFRAQGLCDLVQNRRQGVQLVHGVLETQYKTGHGPSESLSGAI